MKISCVLLLALLSFDASAQAIDRRGSTLKNGLLAWYSFDNTSWLDSHTGGHNLTDNNTVGNVAGKVNNAADCDGSADYLNIPDADDAFSEFGDEDFTLAFWVRPDVIDASGSLDILVENYYPGYTIATDTRVGGNFRARISDKTTNTNRDGDAIHNLANGTWAFVVVWHSAADDLIYLSIDNQSPLSSAHTPGLHVSSNSFNICSTGVDGYYDGLIDEMGIWNRVLTSSERSALWNNGNGIGYGDL